MTKELINKVWYIYTQYSIIQPYEEMKFWHLLQPRCTSKKNKTLMKIQDIQYEYEYHQDIEEYKMLIFVN